MNPFVTLHQTLNAEQERWPLWLPVGVLAGIMLYFALPFEPAPLGLAATPLLAGAVWLLRARFSLFLPAVALLMVALGFNASQIDTRLSATPMLDHEMGPLPVIGRLMFTEVMPEGVRLTLKDVQIGKLKPEDTPVKIRVRLRKKTLADVPPPGSVIRLYAGLMPYSEPVMPGATDFRWQGYFHQTGASGWTYSDVDEIIDNSVPDWRDRFALVFERARLTLARHVYARLSGDVAAMTVTRLNGEQAGISEPVIDAMRIAGLSHLLSTSGFHVTIMGLLVYFPLRALLALVPWVALRFPIKKWAASAAIVSTLGYTLLVGSGAATVRSMIMCAIAMLAILVDRRASPLRLVMLSAFLSMLVVPDAALGPSFQMSFAAVFCLIATQGKQLAWLVTPEAAPREHGWFRRVAEHFGSIIATSLIATAATTPFALYHFQTFSFYGFAANAAAIPLTSFWVMPCILMAYILAPFGLDGWFIDGAGAGIALTIRIAEQVAAWPYSILYFPAMPWGALLAITLGGLWLCIWRLRWRWLGLLPILAGACYCFYAPVPDVLISPDARVWAVRLDDGRLAVSNMDRNVFLYRQWKERLGNVPLVDSSAVRSDQLRCDDAGCVYKKAGRSVAFPETPLAALDDCEQADRVVAAFPVSACAAQTVAEGDWRAHGAVTLAAAPDGWIRNDARRGYAERPWSVGWRRRGDASALGGDPAD